MLLVLLALITLALVYYRLRYVYISRKKQIFLPEISDFLTEVTFMGYQGAELDKEVLKFKAKFPYHKKWFRKIVLSSIINLSQNLKGDLVHQVTDIYVAFDLHLYSLKLIKSWFWRTKCTGIYHFQMLNYQDGQKYIEPYVHSKQPILRSNAFIANLYLTKESFDFLLSYPYPISNVNEYKVIDVFFMKKEPLPGNIDLWLDAKNESIVMLGLKVMMFHNYTGAQDKILSLIDHPNPRIREDVVLAVKELFLIESEQILHGQFHKEDKELKIRILQSLAVIGSESTVLFVKSCLLMKAIDKDIKMELLKCLKSVDQSSYEQSFKSDLEIDKMKLHLNSAII
ncbi:hypothetical protein [Nonlabens marinus]|uniref:HEAT repeat domain-containing protein n=1 Tax=Nonlabens marinus S1-08 TaxID=1454201 RepID=W8VR31_9FLAO|nr:hypothetical protein [Nonlabens marinus]BAO55415.1 hypothetical protein NMS_1406 [Nonlabens marinus S1-08]